MPACDQFFTWLDLLPSNRRQAVRLLARKLAKFIEDFCSFFHSAIKVKGAHKSLLPYLLQISIPI
jgi:hypothetical protein